MRQLSGQCRLCFSLTGSRSRTTAKDVKADTREIEDAHFQARMIRKLVELREETGELRAVNVGV